MKSCYWNFNLILLVLFDLWVAALIVSLLTMGSLGALVGALLLGLACLPLFLFTVHLWRKMRNPGLIGGPFAVLERANSRRVVAFVLAILLLLIGVGAAIGNVRQFKMHGWGRPISVRGRASRDKAHRGVKQAHFTRVGV
jgi:hypothetical protein